MDGGVPQVERAGAVVTVQRQLVEHGAVPHRVLRRQGDVGIERGEAMGQCRQPAGGVGQVRRGVRQPVVEHRAGQLQVGRHGRARAAAQGQVAGDGNAADIAAQAAKRHAAAVGLDRGR
jgi:hypothetical protein